MKKKIPAKVGSSGGEVKPFGAESSPKPYSVSVGNKSSGNRKITRNSPEWHRPGAKIYRCQWCQVLCADLLSLEIHARFCEKNSHAGGNDAK